MLGKGDNDNLQNIRARANMKLNLEMHHTQVSIIWIKEARNELSMKLVQLNHILQKSQKFSVEYDQMARHLIHVALYNLRQNFNTPRFINLRQNFMGPRRPCYPQGVLETYKTNYIPKLNFLMSENIGQRKLNYSGTFFLP